MSLAVVAAIVGVVLLGVGATWIGRYASRSPKNRLRARHLVLALTILGWAICVWTIPIGRSHQDRSLAMPLLGIFATFVNAALAGAEPDRAGTPRHRDSRSPSTTAASSPAPPPP